MPEQLEELNQTVISLRENLEYKAKDEDLLIAIDRAIDESKNLKAEIDKIGRRNKKYWKEGTEKDMSRVHPKKAKITSNRLFTDIETAIPILTAEPPKPTVIGAPNNDIQVRIEKGLEIAYEIKYKMQQKLQSLIRHWFLFRLGVLKYRWDKDKGFMTENVLARKIGFDKRATSKDNCEYVWEEMEDKAEDLIEKFPKKKKQIIDLVGKDKPKSKVKYLEFWGGNGEWVCWKLNNIILDKKKNPNWNYGEKAIGTESELGYVPEKEGENIFGRSQFPYLFLNVFVLGDETGLYDETSLIEEAIPLQEGVNQLEQQILDLNEGQKRVWTASGEAMSVEKFQELINKTGDLGVYMDRKAPVGGLQQVQSGKPDASLFNHLTHLLSEIDNVIGMHSTTRGERAQQETFGGRQLLMGSDYGRLDLIARNVEQVMEEWYNAYLQMLKVYSVEAEILSNGKETIELRKEDIPTNIIIMIKKGSTLPTDDRTKYENAINLAKFGMIDPATLFEEMKYTNIEKRVQDLYAWLQATGKIVPQQPQTAGGGQPAGGGTEQQQEQLTRLQQILSSPQFQQLPPEEQKAMIGKGRQIVQAVKGG